MTRTEYLDACDQPTSHRDYYRQFVTAQIRRIVINGIGLPSILESKDKHFNDIKLDKWDRLAHLLSTDDEHALAARGDFLTRAGAVCILKEAAQQIREEQPPHAGPSL